MRHGAIAQHSMLQASVRGAVAMDQSGPARPRPLMVVECAVSGNQETWTTNVGGIRRAMVPVDDNAVVRAWGVVER